MEENVPLSLNHKLFSPPSTKLETNQVGISLPFFRYLSPFHTTAYHK